MDGNAAAVSRSMPSPSPLSLLFANMHVWRSRLQIFPLIIISLRLYARLPQPSFSLFSLPTFRAKFLKFPNDGRP